MGPSTLGTHFQNLPLELQRYIFSFLVVRTPKWDVTHVLPCIQAANPFFAPAARSQPYCQCAGHGSSLPRTWWNRPRTWLDQPNQWRSKWAPEVRNEYVCDVFWDGKFRAKPIPVSDSKTMTCFCARRDGLEVRLVCREWYATATEVFYAGNMLCFENLPIFIAFMENLSIRWRALVGRLSILATDGENGDAMPTITQMRRACAFLRQLPALSYVEFDSLLLTSSRTVYAFLRSGLRDVRSISFVNRRPQPHISRLSNLPHRCVYPSLAHRVILRGGLPEEVARGIKGQRRKLLKGAAGRVELNLAIDRLRRQMEEIGEKKGHNQVDCSAAREIVCCGDVEQWTKLWRKSRADYVAYLPC